jgi:hypothetical protein
LSKIEITHDENEIAVKIEWYPVDLPNGILANGGLPNGGSPKQYKHGNLPKRGFAESPVP